MRGAPILPKCELKCGEWKSLATDRVVFVPGPDEEVAAVRLIFKLFTKQRWPIRRIAMRLQETGPLPPGNGTWDFQKVYRILRAPKYKGCIVFGRTSTRFRSSPHVNHRGMWHIRPGSFEPLVSPQVFDQAQMVFMSRTAHKTDEDLVNGLRVLLRSKGDRRKA